MEQTAQPAAPALPLATGRIPRFLMMLLGLAMMFGGELAIFRDPPNLVTSGGLVWILFGAAITLYLIGRAPYLSYDSTVAPATPDSDYVEPLRIRRGWVAVAVGLTVWVTLRAVQYPPGATIWEYLALWLGAMVACVLAVAPRAGEPYSPDKKPLRWEWALIVGLVLFAGVLRLTNLNTTLLPFDGDESKFAREGLDLFQGGMIENPFGPGVDSHPRTYTMQIALAIQLLGNTIAAARLPAAIASTLGIGALYLLAREIYGWRAALVAALFITPLVMSMFFARQGLNQPYDSLFGALAFYLLLRGLRRRSNTDYALAGVFLAHSQLYYIGGRLIPVAMVAWLIFQWMRDRAQPDQAQRVVAGQLRKLTIIPVVAVLVLAPHFFHLVYFRQPVSTRADATNILLNGELGRKIAQGEFGQYTADQIFRTFGALYSTRDNSPWVGPGSPLTGPFAPPLLLIGVSMSFLLLWKRPRWALAPGWAFLVMVVVGVFGATPPEYERFVPALPPLALLVGAGAQGIGIAFGRIFERPALIGKITLAIGAFLLIGGTLFWYLDYLPTQHYLFSPTNFYDDAMAKTAMRSVDEGRFLVILGKFPSRVGNSNIVSYQMYPRQAWYFTEDALDQMAGWNLNPEAYKRPVAVMLPRERQDDLARLRTLFPGGQTIPVTATFWEPNHTENTTELVFLLYEAPTGFTPEMVPLK